jgi:hypothetical protein
VFNRRDLLTFSCLAIAAAPFPVRAAALPDATLKSLGASQTIYITPLKKGGAESKCHAEVWFTYDGSAIFVVTSSKAWRARAISLGLTEARMWVGEFGVWQRATEAFRKAPELTATGAPVTDPAVQSQVLERFGAKYRAEWSSWGPKFRNGLADGSRVMLRYSPVV